MKIALDKSAKDCTLPEVFQLRTPLTGYKNREGIKWALDNGCYTEFNETKWLKMAREGLHDPDCLWITMPDEVGCHRVTLELFIKYTKILRKLTNVQTKFKAAFVIQDGCHPSDIPWGNISAVFLGGTTKFKYSALAWRILEKAKKLNKWVHIGRVNTKGRLVYFHDIADSVDGSGLAKYTNMLDDAIDVIRELKGTKQEGLYGDYEM